MKNDELLKKISFTPEHVVDALLHPTAKSQKPMTPVQIQKGAQLKIFFDVLCEEVLPIFARCAFSARHELKTAYDGFYDNIQVTREELEDELQDALWGLMRQKMADLVDGLDKADKDDGPPPGVSGQPLNNEENV